MEVYCFSQRPCVLVLRDVGLRLRTGVGFRIQNP